MSKLATIPIDAANGLNELEGLVTGMAGLTDNDANSAVWLVLRYISHQLQELTVHLQVPKNDNQETKETDTQ